jgi:hypothetical protein
MKARPQRNARCNRWIRSPNVIPAPLPVLWMALDECSTRRACQPCVLQRRAAIPATAPVRRCHPDLPVPKINNKNNKLNGYPQIHNFGRQPRHAAAPRVVCRPLRMQPRWRVYWTNASSDYLGMNRSGYNRGSFGSSIKEPS